MAHRSRAARSGCDPSATPQRPKRVRAATFRRRNRVPQGFRGLAFVALRHRDRQSRGETKKGRRKMLPLACFIGLAVVGQAINLLISLQVEKYVTKGTSILVFFALFLAVFYLAWKLTNVLVDRNPWLGGTPQRQ
jgi:hypothetical protein